jgi:hypothetical protein
MSRRPVGHDGARCGAPKRQGEGTCTQVAGWGTNHLGQGPCKLHGGSTPTVSKGAQLALLERHVRRLFEQIAPEIKPVDNPLKAYGMFAGRVMAWLELMDSLLDDLTDVGYANGDGQEQVDRRVQLYERAMDRANTVLSSYARLRIDERLAQITEEQADKVLAALDAVISYLGATGPRAAEARRYGAAQLRLVSSQ